MCELSKLKIFLNFPVYLIICIPPRKQWVRNKVALQFHHKNLSITVQTQRQYQQPSVQSYHMTDRAKIAPQKNLEEISWRCSVKIDFSEIL